MSMTNEPERFHLLLLASEQIQPNLMVALSLWQTGRLASLAILHTDDRTRSAEPARQIQKLVRAICLPPPGCPPVRAETYRVDFRPQSVVERILGLLAETPGGRWVLNATGGLKSMSAGLPMLAGHASVAHVIYREIGVGQWFRFHLQPLPGLPPMPSLESVSACGADLDALQRGTTLDSVPLLHLIEAQFSSGEQGLRFSTRSAALECPCTLDSQQWASSAASHNWDWRYYLREKKVPDAPARSGPAFEWFVAVGLRALGVRQIVHSLEHSAANTLQEVDLVALHGDRLVFLDLKLPVSDDSRTVPPGDQIRTAAETARMMGGLGATPVLIRPSWDGPTFANLELLAIQHRVTVLGRQDCIKMFSTLADLLGIQKVPASLRDLETWLAGRHRDGDSIFSRFDTLRDSLEVRSREEGAPDAALSSPAQAPLAGPRLEVALRDVARDRECNWLLTEVGGLWLLRVWQENDAAGLPAARPVSLAPPPRLSFLKVWVSPGSGHLTAILEPGSEADTLRAIFKRWPAHVDAAAVRRALESANPAPTHPEGRLDTAAHPVAARPPRTARQPESSLMAERLAAALHKGKPVP